MNNDLKRIHEQAMGEWADYLVVVIMTATTALRTGGRIPPPLKLTHIQAAGAELTYFKRKGLRNYVEVAHANLLMRAARNEAAGKFINNARLWRRAASLIKEGK